MSFLVTVGRGCQVSFVDYPHESVDDVVRLRRAWAQRRSALIQRALTQFAQGVDHSPTAWSAYVAGARREYNRPEHQMRREAALRAHAADIVEEVTEAWKDAAGAGVYVPGAVERLARALIDEENQAATEHFVRAASLKGVVAYDFVDTRLDAADDEDSPVEEVATLAALYALFRRKARRRLIDIAESTTRLVGKAKRVFETTLQRGGRVVNIEQLRHKVEDEAGIARRRADNATTKAAAPTLTAINSAAAQQTQAAGYIWLRTTSVDPRDRHLRRVGRYFRWSDPPEGGHPGTEINCKCGFRPVFPNTPEAEIKRWSNQARGALAI